MTVAPSALVLVLLLGAVNWIAVEIIVNSIIFEDVRKLVDKLGLRVSRRHPSIGRKICYFLTCALCVGVWIGFIEAWVFGGPLHIEGSLGWATFIANGLLYKAPGHLLLQINAWFHNHVLLTKWEARCTEHKAKELRELAELAKGDQPSRDRTVIKADLS